MVLRIQKHPQTQYFRLEHEKLFNKNQALQQGGITERQILKSTTKPRSLPPEEK